MTRNLAAALSFTAVAAASVAATAALVLPRTAIADDITVDTTPFVSARTRTDVRGELLAQPALARTEWALQKDSYQLKGPLTPAEVRADYVAGRREVSALTAEDSGSSYFKMKPLAASAAAATATMGAPAQ
ncbi:hypothetical protein [Ramlibacter sp.]|uniref:hypothetical protein n=1 Tax=Ramlibacter sp. TaxID=1917967 RepID=UPI002C93EAB6|nr:hypothetical protein [Ramlibacter sp.]HWI84369.1 hypothetical protein [Ramlibacter sp.]